MPARSKKQSARVKKELKKFADLITGDYLLSKADKDMGFTGGEWGIAADAKHP